MKKTNWKKVIGWGVAALVIIGVVWHNAQTTNKNDEDKLVVAMNVPLTGGGASYKKGVPNAFKMGVRDELKRLNLPEDSVVFDIQDNTTTPQTALSVYHLQEMRGFDVYFIGMTNEIVAVSPLLNKTNKPNFYDMTGPETMKRGNNQTMRILCNMNMEINLLKDFLKKKKAKTLLFFAENNVAYHEQFNHLIQPMCQEMGITCSTDFYESKERDFHTIVYKLKQKKPDVIFAVGFSGSFFQSLMELYAQEMVNNNVLAPITFLPFINEKNIDNRVKSAFYFTADAFSIPGKSEKSEQFKKNYEKEFGVKPIYNDAYAYDTGVLVARAFAKHGKHITAEDIIAETPYEGASGKVVMDPRTRDLVSEFLLARVNDKGVIEEVKLVE